MPIALVRLKVKDDVTTDIVERLLDLMRTPSGLQSFGWSRNLEEPNLMIGIFIWESLEDYHNYVNSSDFTRYLKKVDSFCTEPVTFFYTDLKPTSSPSLEIYQAGIVEIAVLTKKPGVEQNQLAQVSCAFFERVKQAPGYLFHFWGNKEEDHNVCINLVGWDTKESYEATRSNEALNQLQAAGGLIDEGNTYVYHLDFGRK